MSFERTWVSVPGTGVVHIGFVSFQRPEDGKLFDVVETYCGDVIMKVPIDETIKRGNAMCTKCVMKERELG